MAGACASRRKLGTMKPSRVSLRLAAALAALYAACVLPSEPSGAERIQFSLEFPLPYRVPLRGNAEPRVRVLANGREVPYANYRLETLAPNIVRVVALDSFSFGSVQHHLRGLARGPATVRVAYATGTGTPDTVFSVQVVISSISVQAPSDTSPSSGLTLTQLKQQRTLNALAYDGNDEPFPGVPFTWTSSHPAIATVDSTTGRVTAESEGTATITARADGVSGTALVTVVQAAGRVQVLPEIDTLRTVSRTRVFEAFAFDSSNSPLRPVKVTWRTTNPRVATVDTAGVAVAESAGTALIIATVGPAADTAALIVKQVVRSVDVTPDRDTLTAIDDTSRIVAQAQDSLGFDVPDAPAATWATADATIATVSQTGLVQARKNGLVLVTASVGGQAGSAVVLVRQEVDSVQIVEDSVGLAGEGATLRLHAIAYDRNGYVAPEGRFRWRSGVLFVATVNDTGLVTARGDGRTRITAAPENGGPADAAIATVTGAPQQLIAFDSPQGIEMIRADGSLRATVIPVTGDYYYAWFPQEPAWSRDGTRLAYAVEYTDTYYYGSFNTWAIHTAWADGSSAGSVTTANNGFQGEPTWSPDGTKIAFSRDDGSGWVSLYVMNADGSAVTRLTNSGTANDYEPAWSPDGTKIAFQRNRQGDFFEIYVMNADGSDTTRLTTSPNDDLEPVWSPDGSQLAFTSSRAGTTNVWLMNADGSAPQNLTAALTGSFAVDGSPAWSPDGSQIVFVSTTCSPVCINDLYVVSRAGSGLRRLTTDAGVQRPAWRPPTPLTPPPAAAPAPQARRRSAP